MVELARRIISGKGVLRLDKSSNDFKKAKVITVFADVLRPPINGYANYNYNPPRGRFATLNFMYEGYVVKSESMDFDSQAWMFYPEINYQTGYALQCSYQGVLESFANLGLALGVTPISIENKIEDWTHTDLFWDEILVVCYADTAITLIAESVRYDLCPDQEDKEPDSPPSPPNLPDPVPPGEPLGDGTNPPVSPPYDGENDSGNTEPFPDDSDTEPPPPDPTPDGEQYRLNVSYRYVSSSAFGNTQPIYWGGILDVFLDEGYLYARAFGIVGIDPAPLSAPVNHLIAPPSRPSPPPLLIAEFVVNSITQL